MVLAPRAAKNFARFCSTRSRESQSVNPRLSTFSAALFFLASEVLRFSASTLAPPGRVLNPWTSQPRRARAGAPKTCRVPLGRNFQCAGPRAVFAFAATLRGGAFFFASRGGMFDFFAPQAQSPRAVNLGIIAPRRRICILTHDAEARRI